MYLTCDLSRDHLSIFRFLFVILALRKLTRFVEEGVDDFVFFAYTCIFQSAFGLVGAMSWAPRCGRKQNFPESLPTSSKGTRQAWHRLIFGGLLQLQPFPPLPLAALFVSVGEEEL